MWLSPRRAKPSPTASARSNRSVMWPCLPDASPPSQSHKSRKKQNGNQLTTSQRSKTQQNQIQACQPLRTTRFQEVPNPNPTAAFLRDLPVPEGQGRTSLLFQVTTSINYQQQNSLQPRSPLQAPTWLCQSRNLNPSIPLHQLLQLQLQPLPRQPQQMSPLPSSTGSGDAGFLCRYRCQGQWVEGNRNMSHSPESSTFFKSKDGYFLG